MEPEPSEPEIMEEDLTADRGWRPGKEMMELRDELDPNKEKGKTKRHV